MRVADGEGGAKETGQEVREEGEDDGAEERSDNETLLSSSKVGTCVVHIPSETLSEHPETVRRRPGKK